MLDGAYLNSLVCHDLVAANRPVLWCFGSFTSPLQNRNHSKTQVVVLVRRRVAVPPRRPTAHTSAVPTTPSVHPVRTFRWPPGISQRAVFVLAIPVGTPLKD